MANVTPLKTPRHESDEWQLRVDLAAAFRLSAELGWHEAVANHFSLAVSADGKQFLMNPKWRHFSPHQGERSAAPRRHRPGHA